MSYIFKNNKKAIIEFVIIFLITILICNGFIRMHYTTDTYKIADEGYKNYAINWSLKDGRIIMFLLLMVCDKLTLSIELVNFIFTIIGLLISCIAVLKIKEMLLSLIKNKDIKIECIIILLSYFLIFNFMYVEAIYFLEIIIISISILLFILATDIILKRQNNYLIKSLVLVILGLISYQGTISFFMVFAVCMLIIKNNKVNKAVILDFITVIFISIIAVLINILMIKLISNLIGVTQNRFNINNITNNLVYIIKNFKVILKNTCGLLNNYYFFTYVLVTSFSLIILLNNLPEKKRKNNIIRILLIIFFTICSCFLVFLGTLSSFDCGRMYIILGGLPSMLIMYYYINNEEITKKTIFKIIISCLLAILVIANIVTYIVRIEESRKKNYFEKNYCNGILKYCNENDLKLERACKIPICYNEKEIYFKEIQKRNKMTINEIRGYQSVISGFNVNTESNLIEVNCDDEIKKKYFEEIENGNLGINETYTMYIGGILVMPVFIW